MSPHHQRLTTLRTLMASHPKLDAYIIPSADAHRTPYLSPADKRVEWMSGFTGATATAVVTAGQALVWTDATYYIRCKRELYLKTWTLMDISKPETISIETWLTSHLPSGSIVGIDPFLMPREEWIALQIELSQVEMQLIAVEKNLVDEARMVLKDPPKRAHNDITHLPLKYTGRAAGKKMNKLRKQMEEKNASALVITSLDEVAYTLNLRGSDIPFNPVFFSYLLITPNSVTLFWNKGNIPDTIRQYVSEEGVKFEVKPYDKITVVLQKLATDLSNNSKGKNFIWVSNTASEAICRAASGAGILKNPLTLIIEVSPVALAKMIKNDVELEGFRSCHVRDGVAVVRFYKWLHDQIDAGKSVTEMEAVDKILEFRREEKKFVSFSFETVSAAGESSSEITYLPSVSTPRVIRADDVFLMDSGAHYKDGTTDLTRTRHMGEPTDFQKEAFTRVLKGHIAICTATFPVGIKGYVMDALSRKFLWDVGLDFDHGTGHGVGHFLIVNEGPSGISSQTFAVDPGLQSGQIMSCEPGYYKNGKFGVRHEELLEMTLVTKDSKNLRASNLLGDFEGRGVLGFNILTLAPHQTKFMKTELLDEFELNFLNSYHNRVLNTLGPILRERGLTGELEWLEKECALIKW